MTDLTSLGVKAIRDGVARGDFTAREVAEAFNAAVAKASALNAFIGDIWIAGFGSDPAADYVPQITAAILEANPTLQ